MLRRTLPIWLLLGSISGCGEDDAPAPQAAAPVAQPVAQPVAPAAAPGQVAAAPTPMPGALQQPVQPPGGGPAFPNSNAQLAQPSATVFVPFPPFVVSAASPNTAGLPGMSGSSPPGLLPGGLGQQPGFGPGFAPPGAGPGFVPPGAGPGFVPPGQFGPGVNVPGGQAGPRKPQSELEAYEGAELFAVAPGGKLAATFAVDSSKRPVVYELKLWNLATGKATATLESTDNVRDMAISPDGKLLATVSGGSDSGEMTLWSLPDGAKQSTHNWSRYGNVFFSSDSTRIITTAGKKGIAILDLGSGKVKPKPLKNLAKSISLAASPVEPIVAVGVGMEQRPPEKTASGEHPGGRMTPKELEKKRQEVEQRQQQQAQAAQQKQGGRKGKRKGGNGPPVQDPNAALGLEPGAEGVVLILDLDSLKIRKKLYVTGAPQDLAFNGPGTVLAALMHGGKGEMWDTASWIEQGGKLGRNSGGFVPPQPGGGRREESEGSESGLLVLSPDADWAAARQSPTGRSPADVWDTRTGQSRTIDQSTVSQLGFLPDGTLVCAARDKPLRFFELPEIKPVYPPFAGR